MYTVDGLNTYLVGWLQNKGQLLKHISLFAKVDNILKQANGNIRIFHVQAHSHGSFFNDGNAVADFAANAQLTG